MYSDEDIRKQFKPYIQKLDRCAALKFLATAQAEGIARLLGAHGFTVQYNHENGDFTLTVVRAKRLEDGRIISTDETEELTINRGDFIRPVPNGPFYIDEYAVVKREVFQGYYESDTLAYKDHLHNHNSTVTETS